MILAFKTQVNKKPTLFPEKIKSGHKKHSFRADPGHRWKEGVIVHFATGNQFQGYKKFKQGICTGTQTIRLKLFKINQPDLFEEARTVYKEFNELFQAVHYQLDIYIDEKGLQHERHFQLIANDGFESLSDFINWFFPKDKSGKRGTSWKGNIIHWTNLKY